MPAQDVTYVKVSDVDKAYKRSVRKLTRTYTRTVDEYQWMDEFPEDDIVPSGRENLMPLDVAVGVGAHQVDDAGNEAQTVTPGLAEGAFVYNHTNARFSISLRARAFDKRSPGNFIIKQIKYQSMKCIESVMRKYARMFYGFSTGIVAQCNGGQSSGTTHTITLKNGFGLSTVSDAAFLAGIFAKKEGVALIRGGALVTNAIGTVTARSLTNGTITVAWYGGASVTIQDGDNIVFANGVNGGTISETDYNKWNVGLFDALITDSVHGLAASTEETWASPLYDTAGGSFGFVKIKKMKQALQNSGDTELRRVIYSNGVENDLQARERAAVIWGDSGKMNVDANVTAKGVTFDTSRFTPPGYAFGLGADAIHRSIVTEKPGADDTIDYNQLYKAEDKSALKGGVDMISANIITSRSRIVAYGGLNVQ